MVKIIELLKQNFASKYGGDFIGEIQKSSKASRATKLARDGRVAP